MYAGTCFAPNLSREKNEFFSHQSLICSYLPQLANEIIAEISRKRYKKYIFLSLHALLAFWFDIIRKSHSLLRSKTMRISVSQCISVMYRLTSNKSNKKAFHIFSGHNLYLRWTNRLARLSSHVAVASKIQTHSIGIYFFFSQTRRRIYFFMFVDSFLLIRIFVKNAFRSEVEKMDKVTAEGAMLFSFFFFLSSSYKKMYENTISLITFWDVDY